MGIPSYIGKVRLQHTALTLHQEPSHTVNEGFVDAILAAAKVRYYAKVHGEEMKAVEREYIRMVAANLFEAYRKGRPLELGVFTIMRQHEPTPEDYAKMTRIQQRNIPLKRNFRTRVIDAFIGLGYCEKIRSGFSFKVAAGRTNLSVFQPTEKILEAISPKKVVEKEHDCIINRDINGNRTKSPKSAKTEGKFLKKYNRHWKARVNMEFNPLTRIYINEVLGGRLYSDYQLISGKKRPELIKIDGEKVVELDFKASQLNIASLILTGKVLADDPYNVGVVGRDDMKKLMMYYVNSFNPKSCSVNPNGPLGLTGVEYDAAVAVFEARYPELAILKKSGFGLAAQKIEGDIFMELARIAMERDTVVLTVHDSIIVKESEAAFWQEKMEQVREDICKDVIASGVFADAKEWLKLKRDMKKLIREAEAEERQTEEFKSAAHEFLAQCLVKIKERLQTDVPYLKGQGYTTDEAVRLILPPNMEAGRDNGLTPEEMAEIDHKLIEEGRLPKYFI
jgi:hypothetical protein|nr:MAG TPA: hypothetical protein [Caudoviricetes sp.]